MITHHSFDYGVSLTLDHGPLPHRLEHAGAEGGAPWTALVRARRAEPPLVCQL